MLKKRGAILIFCLALLILISYVLAIQSGSGLIESEQWKGNITDVQRGATVFGDVDLDGDLDLALIGFGSSIAGF